MTARTAFDFVSFGDIEARNRLVMAPMTRNRATPQGLATSLMAEYYAQRAGAGLIVTEGVQPSQIGQGFLDTPGLYTDEHVQSWRRVTDGVHQKGGRIVVQLMHSGRIGHPSLYDSAHIPVAPSPVAAAGQTFTPDGIKDYPTPAELTTEGIRQTVADFVHAAKCAVTAGFDGVELHAGNGFLLHQFMAENTNLRVDAYGGSVTNRVRFAVEVAEAVVGAIGAGRTGMRISPGNPYNDIDEGDTGAVYSTLLKNLPDLAYLHVMEANNRNQTREIRRSWNGPLILNPHAAEDQWPSGPQAIEQILSDNLADGICFGTLFLANPDLVDRLKRGAGLNEADESTFYGGGAEGYTDYPALDGNSRAA